MSEFDGRSMEALVFQVWQNLMDTQRYDLAAAVGVLFWQIVKNVDSSAQHSIKSTFFIETALNATKSASGDKQETERRCNFCGRAQSEVRIVAGPTANICEECASSVVEILRRQ